MVKTETTISRLHSPKVSGEKEDVPAMSTIMFYKKSQKAQWQTTIGIYLGMRCHRLSLSGVTWLYYACFSHSLFGTNKLAWMYTLGIGSGVTGKAQLRTILLWSYFTCYVPWAKAYSW